MDKEKEPVDLLSTASSETFGKPVPELDKHTIEFLDQTVDKAMSKYWNEIGNLFGMKICVSPLLKGDQWWVVVSQEVYDKIKGAKADGKG